ncbi:hypothetical protein [Actinoplanes sp. NPDC051851]|uniref:hypothetical protein n=1 Tax=Actinoplanes sp. NPDC051851 TaxID=3154753 RepID=UPI00342DA0EE
MIASTPQSWFRDQVSEEVAELRHLDAALAVEQFGATSARVRDTFTVLLRERVRELQELREEDWAGLQRLREGGIRDVQHAALGVLEGGLLRGHPLFRDVTAAAERLLDTVVDTTGIDHGALLSMAGAERFERLVGLIRIRFPDVGVWGLPILVHEVGHLVADALPGPGDRNLRPVLDLLAQEAAVDRSTGGRDHDQAYRHAGELFADVFATYALGVAYPLAVITLRARPDRILDEPSPTHPTWSRRIWTMVASLRAIADRLESPLEAGAYRHDADRLLACYWSAVSGDEPPDGSMERAAARQAAAFVDQLDRNAPPRLRYDAAANHDALIGDLLTGRATTATPVEVIGAIWRWRVVHGGTDSVTLTRIGAQALRAVASVTG